MPDQEGAEALRVVRPDRVLHARSRRERRAPGADFRDIGEHARFGDRVEDIEIPEDRRKDRIDQAEALASEMRAFTDGRFDANELRRNGGSYDGIWVTTAV